MSRRVVFDTSTLVGTALRIGSMPYQALQEALATCELCASTETLAELERVLNLRKFDRYLDRALRREFAALIRRHAHLFLVEPRDVESLHPPCRDPGDNKFLALAQIAEADALISSDEDLLVLHPWQEIPILTSSQFLAKSVSEDL